MQEQVRLQKYMAEAGAGSRRKCEEWIRQGLVRVNGEVVTELGTKLDPQKDVVEFRGKVLRPTQELVTVISDSCKKLNIPLPGRKGAPALKETVPDSEL